MDNVSRRRDRSNSNVPMMRERQHEKTACSSGRSPSVGESTGIPADSRVDSKSSRIYSTVGVKESRMGSVIEFHQS